MFPLAGYTDGGTMIIYNFNNPKWNCVGYYLSIQHAFHDLYGYEEVLTEENFTEVEPIEIEGISCSRYAYVKENCQEAGRSEPIPIMGFGNWNAGVVPKIEHKSGDLLTVGIYVRCSGAGNGAWGKIDDALLNSVAP